MQRIITQLTLIAAAALTLMTPAALADNAAAIQQAREMVAAFEKAVNRGRSDLNSIEAQRTQLIHQIQALRQARAANVTYARCENRNGRGFIGVGDGFGFNVDDAGMSAFERAADKKLRRLHRLTAERDALRKTLARNTQLLGVWKAQLARLLK